MISKIGLDQGGFWVAAPKQNSGPAASFLELFHANLNNDAVIENNASQNFFFPSSNTPQPVNDTGAKTTLKMNNSSIWNELTRKYDVRNATFDEIKTAAFQLYQAGQIDLFHLGTLTLDLSKSPMTANTKQFLTPADQSGRRNWIAEWEARANQDLKYGCTLGYKAAQDCLGILHHLEGGDN